MKKLIVSSLLALSLLTSVVAFAEGPRGRGYNCGRVPDMGALHGYRDGHLHFYRGSHDWCVRDGVPYYYEYGRYWNPELRNWWGWRNGEWVEMGEPEVTCGCW